MMNLLALSPGIGSLLGNAFLPGALPAPQRREPAQSDGAPAVRSAAPGERQARLLSIEIEYQATRLLRRESGETVLETTRVELRAIEAYIEAAPEELSSRLRGRFAPGAVAGRIARVARESFEGDLRDRAGAAVREGVDEALRKLRGLPVEIRNLGDQIYKMVELILDQLLTTGEAPSFELDLAAGAEQSGLDLLA